MSSSQYIVNASSLESVADSIRNNLGVSNKLTFPEDFVTGISGIKSRFQHELLMFSDSSTFATINHSGNSLIYSIYSPSGTSFTNYAFANCINLRYVDADNCVIISDYAFSGCTNLLNVTFPKCTSIGYNAFRGCNNLISVSFPSCTSILNSAFLDCSSLRDITFPECINIGIDAFKGCKLLENASFDKCIGVDRSAFCVCESLTNVNIPVCSVISSYAFNGCTNLTSVITGNELRVIGDYAFNGCTNLLSINAGSNFQSIGACAFNGCSNLKSIESLSYVTTVGFNAFEGCTSLDGSIDLPLITSFPSSAFNDCWSIKEINLSNLPSTSYSSAVSGIEFLRNYMLRKADLGSLWISNAYISKYFSACTYPLELKTFIFHVSYFDFSSHFSTQRFIYDKIKVSNFYGTNTSSSSVYGLENLKYLEASYISAIGTTCPNLRSAYCPTMSVYSAQAFRYCYKLENVNINSVVSLTQGTFRSAYNLSYLVLASCSLILGNCFYECGTSYYSTTGKNFSLYLQSTSVVTLGASKVFTDCPLSAYVPSSLYSKYCSASYWSTMTSKIVSSGNGYIILDDTDPYVAIGQTVLIRCKYVKMNSSMLDPTVTCSSSNISFSYEVIQNAQQVNITVTGITEGTCTIKVSSKVRDSADKVNLDIPIEVFDRVPSAYTELAYIQAEITGPVIKLYDTFTCQTKVKMKYSYKFYNSSNYYYLGNNDKGFGLRYYNDSTQYIINGETLSCTYLTSQTDIYETEFSSSIFGNNFYIKDIPTETIVAGGEDNSGHFYETYPLNLFGEHTRGSIYYVKIYEKGELVRDLVPARKVYELGLFDRISHEFCINSGSGSLGIGATFTYLQVPDPIYKGIKATLEAGYITGYIITLTDETKIDGITIDNIIQDSYHKKFYADILVDPSLEAGTYEIVLALRVDGAIVTSISKEINVYDTEPPMKFTVNGVTYNSSDGSVEGVWTINRDRGNWDVDFLTSGTLEVL